MNNFSFELSLLALIPGLLLCGYVFYKDRIEKEPLGLLALLFGIGAVAYVPSFFVQELLIGVVDGWFSGAMQFSENGMLTYSSAAAETVHGLLCAFLGFSLIQILIKWCALFFVTHKNKHFNYLFDGIVYSVFLSLGFAVAENVHFLLQNDFEMLVPKLLTSIPCHLFIGILMGYYYTMWHVRFTANGIEEDMLKAGLAEKDQVRSSAVWLCASAVIPFLVSGLYVFAGSVRNDLITMIFYAVVFVLYGISFVVIRRIAAKDGSSVRYLCRIIAKGHPEIPVQTIEAFVNGELNAVTKEGADR